MPVFFMMDRSCTRISIWLFSHCLFWRRTHGSIVWDQVLVTEIPSVIHVVVFSLGIFLILQESDWPDWQKAIVLASAFLISVNCVIYRFDDYHILAGYPDLLFAGTTIASGKGPTKKGGNLDWRQASGSVRNGRHNEVERRYGVLVATGVCLLFLVRKRKLIVASLFVAVQQ